MPIEYMFCFICRERKIIPNNTIPTFQEVGGVT